MKNSHSREELCEGKSERNGELQLHRVRRKVHECKDWAGQVRRDRKKGRKCVEDWGRERPLYLMPRYRVVPEHHWVS